MESIRFTLITGSGKSTVGNSILGSSRFSSSFRCNSECQIEEVKWFDNILEAVDYPGVFDVNTFSAAVTEEIPKAKAPLNQEITELEGKHGIVKRKIENIPKHMQVKPEMESIRIVLIGKTGSGKSTVGNSILGSSKFSSSFGCNSVTKECQIEEVTRFGRRIEVVDTPGVFDVNTSSATATEEIQKAIAHLNPVPLVYILCIRMGRLTEEDNIVFRRFNYMFRDVFHNHSLILFTKYDSFTNGDRTKACETKNYLGDFIDSLPEYPMSFIQRFRGRYIAFDNTLQGEKADKQVENLLNLLKSIMKDNCGRCYTSGVGIERCLRRKHPYDKNKFIIRDGFIKSHGLKI